MSAEKTVVAEIFPGQGSQKVGMAEKFYNYYDWAPGMMAQANQILQEEFGWSHDLARLCFEGPQDILNKTQFTQPSLFTAEAIYARALHEELQEVGVRLSCVSGHSAGMFGALYAAGVISFEDGVWLTAQRGELMAQAARESPGAMAAVIDKTRDEVLSMVRIVREEEGESLFVAVENTATQLVVAGTVKGIQKARDFFGKERVLVLPISIPSHTPLMAEAMQEFRSMVEKTSVEKPTITVFNDVIGESVDDPKEIRELLIQSASHPVQWRQTIESMIDTGVNYFIESGPRHVWLV